MFPVDTNDIVPPQGKNALDCRQEARRPERTDVSLAPDSGSTQKAGTEVPVSRYTWRPPT
ncbi:hypothetical protein CBM2585_B20087 [Cupriavidus taiwanensis]|nr:hypothetical protein CBM2585_B20087 [Cupriavidus taiwanensis]